MFKKYLLIGTSLVAFSTLNASYSSMSNLYLPYGDEISSKYSDHKLVATDIENLSIATYNSWARNAPSGFDYESEYKNTADPKAEERIKMNASRIAAFAISKPRSFIGLQEWQKQDLGALNNQFSGTPFKILDAKTGTQNFNNALIYNSEAFKLVSYSTNGVSALDQLWDDKGMRQGDQINRYQHAQFLDSKTNQVVDVINVHLKWYQDLNKTYLGQLNSALDSMIKASQNIIIMGDFNTDLTQSSFGEATTFVSTQGSQAVVNGVPMLQTNDAIIYKYASVKPSLQMTTPSYISANQNTSSQVDLQVASELLKYISDPAFREVILNNYKQGIIGLHSIYEFHLTDQSQEKYMEIFEAFSSGNQKTYNIVFELQKIFENQNLEMSFPLGKVASVEKENITKEYIKQHITGSLQKEVETALNSGFLSESEVKMLGQYPFINQASVLHDLLMNKI